MVTFTCDKCNESLKKNVVTKHLWKCKSNSFTCIDCQQNFNNQSYNAHTSCMSEEQRYQGKLYVAKESTNKGQKKQDNWVENLQAYLDQGNGGGEKQFLARIVAHPNVPRKKPKFANFVKTVLKMHDPKKIETIWDHVVKANEVAQKATASNEVPAAPESTSDKSNGEKRPLEMTKQDDQPEKKKIKSDDEEIAKDDENASEIGNSEHVVASKENNAEKKPQAKKQKKNKEDKAPKVRWKSRIMILLNEMGPMTLRKLQSRLYIRYCDEIANEEQEEKTVVYDRIAKAIEKSNKVSYTAENNMVTLSKSVNNNQDNE